MSGNAGLIADIGGTNARFAWVDGETEGWHDEMVLKGEDYPRLADAVKAYLDSVKPAAPITRADFCVAGPVLGDWFEMTNSPWSFSVKEMKQEIGIAELKLFNDFEAVAMAIPHLDKADKQKLGGGEPVPRSAIGVIGPGTGLGVASLFWDGQRYHAVPGEGAHVTMPAKTRREFEIFQHLLNKYSHVSAERVCSGKGLVNVYNTIRALDGRTDLPDREAEEISAAALEGACEVCAECLELMMAFLGRVAGNLALTLGARGGIYVAGGIVSKLGDYIFDSRFRAEFESKGRFKDYMKALPVYIVRHPYPAFVGLQADLMRQEAAESVQGHPVTSAV